MSNTAIDDDTDAVLSDVEEDHPVSITVDTPLQHQISADEFRDLQAELDRERAARDAAESSKSELQVSFNRLKSLAHEAIKKRDECSRQRDDAIREKEEAVKANERLSSELIEANRLKEEIAKQREEIARQFDEMIKERDGLKSETENSRHMLVSGIEKISGKVSNYKNFGVGGLPKSNKYTGFPAVAYGVIKRTNEIVEEMVKQIDVASKSRNEAREQMEQRNYEIAIEVSQLEATISGLRDEVSKKSSIIENLEKKVSEIESKTTEKVNLAEKEVSEMKELVGECDDKLSCLESKIEIQRGLVLEQLNLVARIHDRLYDVTKVVDATHSDSELSESLFLPQRTDVEENARASLAGMESLYELSGLVLEKTRGLVEEKGREVKDLNENVDRLVKEKEQIGSLLRSALSKTKLDTSSKTNELFQAAENSLREVGIDFRFSKVLGDAKVPVANDKNGNLDPGEDEIYTLAGALESIIKTSQLEIIELRHSVEELRAESNSLKVNIEAQANDLSIRMHRIEELEEKLRAANESVEGLMTDTAAAEEEINRWKSAAEQEAAAGRAVEHEFEAQLSTLKQELEEARQAILESEKKLRFKEETATAAMTAREAAEKSLRLADTRASRLREKVEELSRQIEELETRQNSRGHNGPRYVCWPWQWVGMDFVGFQRTETQQQQRSNEMELSEPLL